jgi:Tfp pilus assembly protein PilV
MKAFKFLKNSAGISMVEVMMAVSVMGGLSLTVAQLMKNTSESTKQNEAKQENVNLKGLLQDNLNNTTACTNTFGAIMTPANVTVLSGSTTASVSIPNVKDKVNAIKYSTTSTNIQPLTITSMSLTNYNSTAFTGDFLVNATFKKSTNNIVMVKPIRIPINFSFNGTTLTACSTMAVGGEWMLGGNAGTVDGTDYIGTSDNAPLNFRVDAKESGRIDNAGQTFLGYYSGSSLPYTTSGTGFGSRALMLSSGAFNSAFGDSALAFNTTGTENTAVGVNALLANAFGVRNTGVGSSTLLYNNGSFNTALGSGALMTNATGNDNTALGLASMAYATSGSSNTAVGIYSLYTTSGSNNAALGTRALYRTSGSSNTALGSGAGAFTSSGSFNTFIGANAAPYFTSGSNNIFIGNASGGGATSVSNKLYIDSSSITVPLIGGDFSARQVHLNGNVGIGTTTPGTPSTPVVATAGVTRLHVTGGETILDQEAWTNIPLTASWTSCSYSGNATAKYFKDSVGVVHLKGCIRPTVAGASMSGVAFFLPAGYGSSANAGYLGPLPRREASTMGYPSSNSNCWIYFDGGTSTNFWMYSDTLWDPTVGKNGCDLNGVTWRGDI